MIDRSRILVLGSILLAAVAACFTSASGSPSAAGSSSMGTGGGSGGANTGGGGSGPADDAGSGGGVGDHDAGGADGAEEPPFPYFGPNVLIFDPSMPMDMIQTRIDAIVTQQKTSQYCHKGSPHAGSAVALRCASSQ